MDFRYSTNHAAKVLGISRRLIEGLMARKVLHPHKLGGRYYFDYWQVCKLYILLSCMSAFKLNRPGDLMQSVISKITNNEIQNAVCSIEQNIYIQRGRIEIKLNMAPMAQLWLE